MADGPEEPPTRDLNQLLATFLPELEKLPRNPQQARSIKMRANLLKEAMRLFTQQGYSATSADTIAKAAHASVGSFYNYFRDKRQILLVLVVDRLEAIFSSQQFSQMDFSLGEKRAVIRATLDEVLSPESVDFRRVWVEFVSHDPELASYQDSVRRGILKEIERRLRVVADEGLTWPELDIEAAALSMFTLLESLSLNYIGGLRDSRLIDGVTDFIYRAIFPPKPPAKQVAGKPHKHR